MKQEERRERRIREILNAAMEEFGANGYENVTMDSLCARHHLSKGVLYHYFSNRDELFLLCVESVFRDLRAYLEQKLATGRCQLHPRLFLLPGGLFPRTAAGEKCL